MEWENMYVYQLPIDMVLKNQKFIAYVADKIELVFFHNQQIFLRDAFHKIPLLTYENEHMSY